jgi:hypothetical protein
MSKQPDNKSDRILSKRDLFFAWFRYNMFGHVAQSTDRLQGGGFCVAISRWKSFTQTKSGSHRP